MLKVGDKAPDFAKLRELRGKKVVLYFYPKDDTPGCTTEACEFRDLHKAFGKNGAVVVGVSPDGEASHEKFRGKFELPFVLVSDVDKKIVEAYGVWKEKSMYGRKYMGVERTTFLIDEKGMIAGVWERVKVKGHAEEVLAAVSGSEPRP
jgi:thioredoxin-dependent peroxiredoxin